MKNKFKITMLVAVALLTVTTIGVTVARMQTQTGNLTNIFVMGNVETEIEEDGEGTIKKSRIKNVGENACLVRARVMISPAEAAEHIVLTDKAADWNWDDWENGDGYIYYTKVLPAGETSYTSYLFEGVALKEGTDWKSLGINTFDVTVYEESVQVEVYDPDTQTVVSALNEQGLYDAQMAAKVWEVYESSNANE